MVASSDTLPNFDIHHTLNTEFVTAYRHAKKKKNHQSKAEAISNPTVHSQFFQHYFSRAKIKI